ncbi:uncharacterized protein [Clytia hemisphaerica]|uniref:uncharacterized protein n=1 Tax=Clytia hemisphaerica TaxID=252671 RepID=UPI0034D51C48
MFLSYKLLRLELQRNDCWKDFLQYQKFLEKVENHNLRIVFLNNCLKSKIIPRFLKFRIPNNGCFDDRSVHEFQINLLRKELHKAATEKSTSVRKLDESRDSFKQKLPNKCTSSVILHTRYVIRLLREQRSRKLNDKLFRLSNEQERPLFNVNNTLTKRYLKENELVAIPFDKGVGICLMKRQVYNQKLENIINLPQFQKVVPKRKNEKNAILKEEERILAMLKSLKNENKISESLFLKMKPIGSQPARLYGLAKIHKPDVPARPVLSMPGSSYCKIASQIAEWLSIVEECNINSSTKSISDSLHDIKLQNDDVLVSFDVSSLYTNVPVYEAIEECTNLLYSGKYKEPPVDKSTFKKLAEICSCNVIMLTHDGYYKQIDGLAMGSPPARLLANGWMHKFDCHVKDDACLFARYMDDYLRNIRADKINEKLEEINNLHQSLKFTIEYEKGRSLPFLDMLIQRSPDGDLTSTWYSKETDTGLLMNFHALAPITYKRSVVAGMVHQIFRACNTWKNIHQSLEKAKKILENNQYPPAFYDPIIEKCLNSIIQPEVVNVEEESIEEEEKLFFLQYRGKLTDKFKCTLKRMQAPCKTVLTLRKLKTVLPPLKPPIEKALQSGVVYMISCPRCDSRYVGQSVRHLTTRIKEHAKPSTPVGIHCKACDVKITMENDVVILARAKYQRQLLIKEALYIKELRPSLNTKDEFKSHTLIIKF